MFHSFLSLCEWVPVYYLWRPNLRDEGDNHLIELAVAGRALLYSVGAIDLSAGDRAEAAAGYNYDGYSSAGYTFSVERSDSGWVVKQWRMEWTSKSPAP